MSGNHLSRRLSPMDAFFLYLEREEQPMHVGAVCIFDGKVPFRQFRSLLASRLHLLPRYRQRVIPAPLNVGHPTWEDDPDFDIDRHLIRAKLGKKSNDKQLRRLASKIFTGPLNREKPLWELHFFEGYEGDKTVLVMKVHHCMVDGVAGIGMAFLLLDVVPDPPKRQRKPRYKPEPLPDSTSLFYDALWDNATEGLRHLTRIQQNFKEYARQLEVGELSHVLKKFAGSIGNFLLPVQRMPFNKPFSGERLFTWRDYPYTEARAIRAMCGGSLNDVALAVLGNAIRMYLQDHHPKEAKKHRNLRVLVPVNVRQESERAAMGNRISALVVDVPIDFDDPTQILYAVQVRTRELKEARISRGWTLLFDALQVSPPPLQALSLGTFAHPALHQIMGQFAAVPPGHLICTNVPGPQIPLYCLGKQLLGLYPTLPVAQEMGINFALVSYYQKLHVGLIADGQAGWDAETIMEYFDKSFKQLREAAEVKGSKYVQIARAARTPQKTPS